MKYSVIIPLYNKATRIKSTIESVLGQTEQDFELIIVDDGSTDESASVVKKIQSGKIRLIQQKNSGVAAARNCGIRSSYGEYITFLDADDIWLPNFLETINKLTEKFPNAGLLCPSYCVNYGDRTVYPQFRSVEDTESHLVKDFLEMATAPFWVCNSSCVAIRRETIFEMEYWFPEGETVYEDFDFWIRIGTKSEVAHSNTVCSVYMRATETNARSTHYSSKVVYSETFMKTLAGFLESNQYNAQQKNWVKQIKDRRMVPYIFSLFCIKEREKAIHELRNWQPTKEYKKYKYALQMLRHMPMKVFVFIQKLRNRIF